MGKRIIRTDREGRRAAAGSVNPNQVVELGAEALAVVRNVLAMRFRFLDRALWKMELVATPLVNLLGTDTRKVYYNPTDVLRRFADSRDELTRDVLHAVFHCLFYHPFARSDIEQGLWDLACDIVAEQACLDLAAKSFPSKGDSERSRAVGQLETVLGNLSAEKLYLHFRENEVPAWQLFELDELFVRDEHGLWYPERGGESDEPGPAGPADDAQVAPMKSRRDASADNDSAEDEASSLDDRAPEAMQDGAGGDEGEPQLDAANGDARAGELPPHELPDEKSKEEWEHIAERVKVEIKNSTMRYGTEAGTFGAHLAIASRKRHDYREFLRRFAETNEEMRLNPDEFDLVYYSFGLDMYGNVPLVEPLEYTDSEKVRTFVVAIDTSGSVQGELVERFISETYTILSESGSYFHDSRVRILQCDARVQDDVEISSREQLDAYLDDFELLGMGGTDFRPVFEHVDALLAQGELEGLRGLVYFTDGKGTYPARPPDYECVFVFVDDEYGVPKVPPWAYKLVLDEFQLKFPEKPEG